MFWAGNSDVRVYMCLLYSLLVCVMKIMEVNQIKQIV